MKILIPLLLLTLGVNANEVVYGSKSGTVESGGESTVKLVDVAAGEAIEIMNVIGGRTTDGFDNFDGTGFSIKAKYGELPSMGWQVWNAGGSGRESGRDYNDNVPVVNNMLVGPCTIQLQPKASNNGASFRYQVSYKITSHQRGDLIPGDTPPFTGIDSGTREQSETFSYDRMGNWLGYTSQTPSLTQTRTHNKDNEIASLTNPSGVVQPAYDAAGNMTEMPSPDDWTNAYTCTWDAWNRLVEVKDGTTTVATYRYDGQTRRITKELASESRSYYFNNQWRALEERVSGIIDKDYVWNPANRWNLIQYRYSDSTTLDTVRYVLKDGLDPVAVIDSSGTVKERAFYEAFGPVTFMDANFANESSSSGEEWTFLFHGELIDTETGLYNYGYRYYHPQLGRWTIKDPIGERGGINLYAMVGNNPASVFDSFGKVPVGVNYTPPCPHCLVPKEGNALQVSHTNYPKNKQKCSCKCVCPDEETGDWFIECEVSFEAEIFLSSKELGINGATWSTIYGHEQQHIVSRTGLVQKVVEEMEAKNGGPFSSSSKCDRSRREWQFDLCNKFRDQLDPKKNPPHRGDVGQDDQEAAHDAPGNGEPIPPLPGTHEDIVSGLEYLETIGYGE